MNDEETVPPKVNTPRKALAWLWEWSQAHTMVTACVLSFVAGWIVAKL